MTMKYKLIALFGPAGSGKDYIQKEAIKTEFGQKYLSEIISYTTRPQRENEIDGVHYHFFSKIDDFFGCIYDKKTEWLEFTEFKGWYYGTPMTELKENRINIGVFNITGINTILKNKHVECMPIYIKTLPKIRLLRQLQRENNPNCDEIIRRYSTDQKDFSNIPFTYYIIENNYDEINMVVKEILDIIPKEWYDKVKID